MSVKLRLQRVGTHKVPLYRIVAVDSRKKRDGEVIEFLGNYNPLTKPPQITLHPEPLLKWLKNGAQPSETVTAILKVKGILENFTAIKQGKDIGIQPLKDRHFKPRKKLARKKKDKIKGVKETKNEKTKAAPPAPTADKQIPEAKEPKAPAEKKESK